MAGGGTEGAVGEAHPCARCPELPAFPSEVALLLHAERHHQPVAAAAPPEAPAAPELEDGELPAQSRVPEPGRAPASRRFFECPECRKPFGTPETLSFHVERHREVMAPILKNGEVVSTECPKGCGRHFVGETNSEYRAHVPMCNGAKPLGPRVAPQVEPPKTRGRRRSFSAKRAAARPIVAPTPRIKPESPALERKEGMSVSNKLKCSDCQKPFGRQKWLDRHMEKAHGKKIQEGGGAARASTPQSREQIVNDALAKLRQEREALLAGIPELQKLEAAITALEGILSGDPT